MTNTDELTLRNKINYKIETLEEELIQISRPLYINKATQIRIKQIEYALTVLKMLIPEEWIKDYD